MTRCAWAATLGSCVTITTVSPCSRCRRWKISITSAPDLESRLPVGSSASKMDGCCARARAIATRCCCPPESSVGRWCVRSPSPTSSSISRARFARSPRGRRFSPRWYCRGSITCLRASTRESRLKLWKTKPISRLRTAASWVSFMPLTSTPFSQYSPEVGESRQPMMCISVDLPEPEGPVMATHSPLAISSETPSSAWTSASPVPYTLVMFWMAIISLSSAKHGIVHQLGVLNRIGIHRYHIPLLQCRSGFQSGYR